MPLSPTQQKYINAFIIIITIGSTCGVIVLFYLFVFPLYQINFFIQMMHIIFHCYVIYSLFYFYIKCIISVPSKNTLLYNQLFPHYIEQYGERYCEYCKKSKPLRVHHCSTCKQCIGRYDHHCLLICNCIGDYTMRLFINTIIYFFIGSLYLIVMISYLYYNTLFKDIPLISVASCCSIFGISIAISIAMGLYLIYYFYLIYNNYTTIELIALLSENTKVLNYNRGFYNNWKEIMLYNIDLPLIYSFIPIDPLTWNNSNSSKIK
ncbi:DHHC zinc finger domain containing protein [Entamoeba histolytica HM-1:IMSS-B]|uniref:Palmitoyltransferase n=5 Tax=Entamoeba histolytica TaxID=5759 RepID=C4M7K1_ENTH1|nr:zinc finger protein, putative [Entamoeba histolytica HM-1:IMSS]EMD48969.1 zinc finger protein, putative [Entamoeba histolytica KU27]EMH77740.1 DHHC zinc finger domain containing protein [Entamoeba histolytica HM-1:IMSS-B]ENY64770.1 zinc finger protein, putative [Entamoeba histolytica HM-1:IMSS-A]GAT97519.1 hypothetical protein conserved domain containing [Entamoeba histolytica]EAL45644.1 zinc finger protein, putative [Entamoeba histolytica HM-1:IMSS]|eukprot:XP_651030.1 zinc finger protein, putative [Entamoeba histolytica HM-1:IMSS]